MYHELLELRNAIIIRAIDDYKGIVTGEMKSAYGRNLKEIERFFNSEYCAHLLVDSTITGPEILEHLQKWKKEYYYNLYCDS